MTFLETYKLAKVFFPGIRAKSFPSIFKFLFKLLGWLFTFFGLLITILPLIIQSFSQENSINFSNSEIAGIRLIGIGMLMSGFGMITAIFLGKSFSNSFYYKGLEQRLPDFKKNQSQVTYEVAEIFFNYHHDLITSFFSSKYGKEILLRSELGQDFYNLAVANIHSNDKDFYFPEKIKIDLFVLAEIIISNSPELQELLFKFGKSKTEFLESAKWVSETIERRKNKIRTWDKNGLSKVSGIGKGLSYGYTKMLEKFTNGIEEYPEFRDYDKDDIKMKEETGQLISILAKDAESNAMLVGETSSGMFDILFKLGHEINDGTITPQLESKRIMVMDGTILVASTGDKKNFEDLFLTLLSEAAQAGNIILVIDKLTAFIETAHAIGSDVISLLDPYLSSKRLQLIALANTSLYYQILERNPAIVERFGIVQIKDSDFEKSIKILQEIAENQENRHGVLISYPAIYELVQDSDRYISQGIMPDKAIDLLLEIIPFARENGKNIITKEIVQTLIKNKTGVKLGKIDKNEADKLIHLEQEMQSRVVGQKIAISRIANTIRRSRSGIQNPNRPIGSFLFLGPTGVGKTEVCKSLAQVLFGDENAMSRFDMSEYTSQDSVDKLIGSFETGQTGTLVSALKKNPYGLILLDEFEKSNSAVKDLFLQILDEGMFKDMQGKKINARNSIFIATSNAGARMIWEYFENNQNLQDQRDELIDSIIRDQVFKPELLNRFDDIVIFEPLDQEKLQNIAILMLRKLQTRIYDQKRIKVNFSNEVVLKVASEGINPQFGARPMNRYIQDKVERAIANKIVAGLVDAGSSMTVEAIDLE